MVKSVVTWIVAGTICGVGVVMLFAGIVRLSEGHVDGVLSALMIGVTVGAIVGLIVGTLSGLVRKDR